MSTKKKTKKLKHYYRTDLIINGYIREFENFPRKIKKYAVHIPLEVRDIILMNIDDDLELNTGIFQWDLTQKQKTKLRGKIPIDPLSLKIAHLSWDLCICLGFWVNIPT